MGGSYSNPVRPQKRRRPKSNLDEAQKFIEVAIQYQASKNEHLTGNNLDVLKKLFSNYAHNTKLRGKEKESVWRIVKAEILQVKEEEAKEAKAKK